jgi:RimJ/RimL family protein N-acetyltransferase
MTFLPDGFEVPTLLETERFRLRPITIHDVVRDYDAVMTSAEHLRSTLPWSWPPEDLTLEQDLIDLGWHQKEFQLRASFAYAVMSLDERRLLGCVYVDPPTKEAGFDAEMYLWVRADELETGLEEALEEAVRGWVSEEWPFEEVIYPGRDLTFDEWEGLLDREEK